MAVLPCPTKRRVNRQSGACAPRPPCSLPSRRSPFGWPDGPLPAARGGGKDRSWGRSSISGCESSDPARPMIDDRHGLRVAGTIEWQRHMHMARLVTLEICFVLTATVPLLEGRFGMRACPCLACASVVFLAVRADQVDCLQDGQCGYFRAPEGSCAGRVIDRFPTRCGSS